jgi:effector-binding domain-containing protein
MSVEILTVSPQPTAVVRDATTWDAFPALWPRLLDEVYGVVRPRRELSPFNGPELWKNVMLYKDSQPNVEVGVLASGPFEPVGRVCPSELPGGRVAFSVHRGDYARLGDTHYAIGAHVEDAGLQLAGPRWEIYGHHRENPDELETEIFYLLA